jgi:hypothetical protein
MAFCVLFVFFCSTGSSRPYFLALLFVFFVISVLLYGTDTRPLLRARERGRESECVRAREQRAGSKKEREQRERERERERAERELLF